MAGVSPLKIIGVCFTFCIVISTCHCLKRQLKTTYWPDCEKKEYSVNCTIAKGLGLNLVYTKATAKNHDNLHYVFSTIGVPVMSILHTTGSDANLAFDWNKLLSKDIRNSISFPTEPKYKFAVAFTNLIQYNDTKDEASLNSKNLPIGPEFWDIQDFRNFYWDSLPDSIAADKNEFVFNTTSDFVVPPQKSNNGSLSFSFKVHGAEGRASELPALPFTANETLFDFVLDNYTPLFKRSRFALEMVYVSSRASKKMTVETIRSIDDEYSPGVFQINNLLSDPSKESTTGFMQWKPVSYLSTSRERKSATEVHHYDVVDIRGRNETEEQVGQSVVAAIFGDVLDDKTVLIKASNISFGLENDGYYLKNNYTAWSAAVGYGKAPADSLSSTVIIIISAGLGIPVLIIVFGGIYTCIRRSRRGSDYQVIGSVDRSAPQ